MVKVVAEWAKVLKENVEMMDADYKARIVDLKARLPTTPPGQHEAILMELKATSATITLRLEDAQKLLEDVNATWTVMEEIPDLVMIHEQV